jgi:hypothetical protein
MGSAAAGSWAVTVKLSKFADKSLCTWSRRELSRYPMVPPAGSDSKHLDRRYLLEFTPSRSRGLGEHQFKATAKQQQTCLLPGSIRTNKRHLTHSKCFAVTGVGLHELCRKINRTFGFYGNRPGVGLLYLGVPWTPIHLGLTGTYYFISSG